MIKRYHQLSEKLKHAQKSRILLTSPRFIINEVSDKVNLIIAVDSIHKEACESLTRLGRETITQLMVHEFLTHEEACAQLAQTPKVLAKFLERSEDNKTPACLLLCSVIKRSINIMPRA
jgi:stalled ribosome rescue protein Dom34